MRISFPNLPGSLLACLLFPLLATPSSVLSADEAEHLQTMELQYAPAPADNPLRGFVPFRGDYETAEAGEEPTADYGDGA